jgi:hypothetical protein
MMNFTGTSKLLAAAAAMLALQACSTSPALDARFGDAANIAKAQQTLNPDASKNRNVVAGLDGKAAQETMVRYRESFKNPPPPANVFNIGIGGGSSQ